MIKWGLFMKTYLLFCSLISASFAATGTEVTDAGDALATDISELRTEKTQLCPRLAAQDQAECESKYDHKIDQKMDFTIAQRVHAH